MPGVREFIEQFFNLFQSAATAMSGMKGKRQKKEKKPQTFRGGGAGSIDLTNYNPKDQNKEAQLGGSAAALKSQRFSAGTNLKNKLKKNGPPKLQGRGNSKMLEKKIGVTKPERLKRSF